MKRILAVALVAAGLAHGADLPKTTLTPYKAERRATGSLSSIGDRAMGPLMDRLFASFRQRQPGVARGRWQHDSDAPVIGALMFEIADLAPLARELTPPETAPYAHQFAGDMMKAPVMVRVASLDKGECACIALNKRPGAPLPPRVSEFLAFALSEEGQRIVTEDSRFVPLDEAQAAIEREKIGGFLAKLDPALMPYRVGRRLAGTIRSVGSDGMKTLMDRWMRDFHRLQPGVGPGLRWEHVGTLNGFNALLVSETDIAPMGRELWPAEHAAYEATRHRAAPFEIRVARGGFNTPQRTTAQAIFVHAKNPLERITLAQIEAIFSANPTITRWGQLGLGGEWSDRPIVIYMPPHVAPNVTSMQVMALKGGEWNNAAHEGTIVETAAAIARDPAAIGFGGFEEGGPGLKTLAVARDDNGPFYEGDYENASTGRYPLTRYMYIRLHREPGAVIPPHIREFLRYILSRDGQEPILYSGYFPLTAAETAEELKKLD